MLVPWSPGHLLDPDDPEPEEGDLEEPEVPEELPAGDVPVVPLLGLVVPLLGLLVPLPELLVPLLGLVVPLLVLLVPLSVLVVVELLLVWLSKMVPR